MRLSEYRLLISYLGIIVIMFFCVVGLICLVSGCGHTITHTDRGTGFVARIPLPDGSSLIDLKVGKIDSTTTVLRGNSVYDSSASTGGSLFGSASTSDRTYVSTGVQLNEGYLRDVLTDPNVDSLTKTELAKVLAIVPAAPSKATTIKSVSGVVASGDNPPIDVEPVAVGVDNAVNRVAEVTPKVVTPVAETAQSVVKDVTTTVSDVSDDWKLVGLLISLAVVLVCCVAGFVLVIRHKKKITISQN